MEPVDQEAVTLTELQDRMDFPVCLNAFARRKGRTHRPAQGAQEPEPEALLNQSLAESQAADPALYSIITVLKKARDQGDEALSDLERTEYRMAESAYEKTLDKIQKAGYTWKGIYEDIKHRCQACLVCQMRHNPAPAFRQPMISTSTNTVFAKVGVDATGPFKTTDRGNRSEFFKEICAKLGINKRFCTPYHSQGNAATERSFKTVQDALSKLVNEKHDDWDLAVPYVTFCYNTTTHETTGESPFYLLMGRDPVFSIQHFLDPDYVVPITDLDTDDFKAQLIANLRSSLHSTRAAQ
ncbi:integrase core domain containing protein [Aphelenchoides avenae]|nr:integrase core domain containing protein [Aphelenchus avenae]